MDAVHGIEELARLLLQFSFELSKDALAGLLGGYTSEVPYNSLLS